MSELVMRAAAMGAERTAALVRSLLKGDVRRWAECFEDWAHEGQRPPHDDWRTWVIMGGRGFGKTRAGAEWVVERVRAGREGMRVALVGATIDDAKAVMVEGPSGLLRLAREGEVARWTPAERRLVFANGAEAALFSGSAPRKLRGPEHDLAWADELGAWPRAGATWDMLLLGLRHGDDPQAVVTTTPSAEPALRRVLDAPGTVVTGGRTGLNRHLAPGFAAAMEQAFGGTRLGAQEIEGRLLADREGSLWPWDLIERSRVAGAGELGRVVVGVDPPATAAGTCGIVVAGLERGGRALVLADLSVAGRSPEGWARAVADAAAAWGADRVVVKANQGGDMVRTVLRAASIALPLELVRASRGKAARAEPVAALFESGRAAFAGRFPELEEELGRFTAGGWEGERSPDRADAMVWALWALMIKPRVEPRVRIV